MENEEQKEEEKPIEQTPNIPKIIPKKIGIVNTYAEDITKVIEKGEGGIIKKMIEEQEKQDLNKKNLSPTSAKNKLFMFISALFILSAILLLFFLTVFKKQISSVNVFNSFTPIIFTDKISYKEIAQLPKEKIIQTVLNEITSTDVKSSGVEGFYLTENQKIVGLRRFITLISGSLVLDTTNFVNDNFLLGIFNEGVSLDKKLNKDLFILLQTRSFVDIFPAMKTWENKMFSDLHGFFGVDINADTKYLLTKEFEDGFVGNKNARILRDLNGQIVLEYIFANDTSVIVTNKDLAAQEVMLRLASGQIKK